MHSKNFLFWKTAFERKQVDIYTLAQMTGVNGELTSDEFQEITGMNYIPNITNNEVTFISTSDIVKELAATRIANMKKDNIINDLTKQVALGKIADMKKDTIISDLTKQIAINKLELMKLKNKEI